MRQAGCLVMTYLLDTNAWIELLNRPKGKLATRLASHAPVEVALSAVALGELLAGAYKSSQASANLKSVQQLVSQFAGLPFDEICADRYGQIRAHLEKIGQPIGPYDMQIAATALRHG